MIVVIGSVNAKREHFDEVLALSQEHVERSRAEPGCLEHGVSRSVEDPLRLVFVERWADREALAAHFALPASRGFVAAISKLLTSPPELHVYQAEQIQI
ncbi:MAG: putative quinol monooxygenase [Acidobacteriota bacterium]